MGEGARGTIMVDLQEWITVYIDYFLHIAF